MTKHNSIRPRLYYIAIWGERRDCWTAAGCSVGCKLYFQMSESDFKAVPDVEIDTGVFKYVLIRLYRFAWTEGWEMLYRAGFWWNMDLMEALLILQPLIYSYWKSRDDGEDTREEKDLVRGYTFAEYHADVYDRTEEEVTIPGRLHARLHML